MAGKNVQSGKSCGEVMGELAGPLDYTDNISIEDRHQNRRACVSADVFRPRQTARLIECATIPAAKSTADTGARNSTT